MKNTARHRIIIFSRISNNWAETAHPQGTIGECHDTVRRCIKALGAITRVIPADRSTEGESKPSYTALNEARAALVG